MQKLFKKSILSAFAALAMAAPRSEEAVVNEGKINVRGQPSLIGEVVTQLQRGDKVTVLERVKIENPKPGEPAAWAKIKLPRNTPVWVFSPFVKDGVVSASRLNLRAGPGDNYSVVGRLEKGAKIKSVRTIEEWMEIEAPDDAYAFVDASLVKSSGGEAAAATTVAAVPAAATETAKPEASPLPNTSVPAATPTPPLTQPALEPATQEAKAPTVIPAIPLTRTESQPAPATAAPPAASAALPSVAAAPSRSAEAEPVRRIVAREGFVRATKSIQAPTWYELVHPQTKAVINYLHEEKIGKNLKEFRGQKVVVTGEEAIDPRWPNTPILEIETLVGAP